MAPAVLRAQARLHPLADAPARPRRKVPVRGQCSNAGPPPLLYALAAAAVTARFAGLLCRYIAYIEPFLVRHQADVDGSVATLLQRAGEFQIHDLGKFGSLAATKGRKPSRSTGMPRNRAAMTARQQRSTSSREEAHLKEMLR